MTFFSSNPTNHQSALKNNLFSHLIVSYVEHKAGFVIDDCPVLELALGLDQNCVSGLGPAPLDDPVNQDALLDGSVLGDVAPHVLGLVRRDVVATAAACGANGRVAVLLALVVVSSGQALVEEPDILLAGCSSPASLGFRTIATCVILIACSISTYTKLNKTYTNIKELYPYRCYK